MTSDTELMRINAVMIFVNTLWLLFILGASLFKAVKSIVSITTFFCFIFVGG